MVWDYLEQKIPPLKAGEIYSVPQITISNSYQLANTNLAIILYLRDADNNILQATLVENKD